jgi:uncharacterized protein (TIGR03118 family)
VGITHKANGEKRRRGRPGKSSGRISIFHRGETTMASKLIAHKIWFGSTCGALACAALVTAACSSDNNNNNGSDAGTGGSATGGKSATGGSGTGGSKSGSGGTSAGGSSSGGSSGTSTGGTNAGGKTGTGGKVQDGGPSSDGGDGGPQAVIVKRTDLVSNMPGTAPTTDPALLNAWGLALNPTAGLFWVSENHSGQASVYAPTGGASKLDVRVPGPADSDGGFTSSPTGQIFNGTAADFMGDKFIVDAEDGTILGWQTQGDPFVLRVDNSADSVYKGLALIKNGANAELVAANFHKGTVDVFDSKYKPVNNPGFVDAGSPALPAGYAPFNAAQIGDNVYITYALQDADKEDDTAGAGHGYVSVFKTNGTFVKRLVSAGDLNSPWGLEVAPAGWGAMTGALLVGNFGDGSIHAYDLSTGELRGTVSTSNGPLTISGLWALAVGPNTAGGDFSKTIFFTAGPNGEDDGLYGTIDVVK